MTFSRSAVDFIDDARLESFLAGGEPAPAQVREIIAKSLSLQPLTVEETAVLLRAERPELLHEIFSAARELKHRVYGRRIVLFAPLYVGNRCVNDCAYCGFRRSNPHAVRRTLTDDELRQQIAAMVSKGHKRSILVFGEHRDYDAGYIARCVELAYSVRVGHGQLRRVNVNAAPLDEEGFRIVKGAEIGVYQVFHETYHHATYAALHPRGTRKADYLWRLDSPARAMDAGIGDVGIGALFGLADWRFEVLGLISHARHLQQTRGCGPHTISFPRIRPASGVAIDGRHLVSDDEYRRLVAILRLAAPYAGLICTAREGAAVRREALALGVSQIDAGSRIELGGYTEAGDTQQMDREQFQLGDLRPLDDVVAELLASGYIPSWCTACYRVGRTGQSFMELASPGFIQRFCTPNALSTLTEYLADYASPTTRDAAAAVINAELAAVDGSPRKAEFVERLKAIRTSDARDLFY